VSGYSARDVTILEGLEPVRRRPGMYIGGVGKDGLHHLVWELVDNAVDEAINGFASRIEVILGTDGSVTVDDNGRGIPVERHPKDKAGRSTLEVILTTLHAGAKFDGGTYKTAGGLHGVGASVVNALSASFVVRIRRDGRAWEQRYRRGRPTTKVKDVGAARGTGSRLTFRPDEKVFESVELDAERIARHLEVKTYLHSGLRIVFRDETAKDPDLRRREFMHEGGIVEYLGDLLQARDRVPVIEHVWSHERYDDEVRLEVALTWTEATDVVVHSFVNGIPTSDGGTHEAGLRDAINRALRDFVEAHDLLPRGISVSSEDIREGLTCALNLFIHEPQFQGQTKDKLNNPEVRGLLSGTLKPALESWLHDQQTAAQCITTRVIQAARARLASRSAAAAVRRKARTSVRLNLPGKLADCTSNDPAENELFVVEGDSAGGSAKQGRDRHTQAVLPLRGKVLNAEQATDRKVMANKELSDVVRALGCGMGRDLDLSKLRYHKLILLMDADSDGHHIATLLLTFLYRYLKPLIDHGHVFLARPPLYRIDIGKETQWAPDERSRKRILRRAGKRAKPQITRFKGLGEMPPATLYRTTMDPDQRRLLQVRIRDRDRLETERTIQDLMGRDSSARFEFVTAHAHEAGDLDI